VCTCTLPHSSPLLLTRPSSPSPFYNHMDQTFPPNSLSITSLQCCQVAALVQRNLNNSLLICTTLFSTKCYQHQPLRRNSAVEKWNLNKLLFSMIDNIVSQATYHHIENLGPVLFKKTLSVLILCF
jgi:hypothetical protein